MSEAMDGDLVLEIPTDVQSIAGAVDYVMSRCVSMGTLVTGRE